MKFTITDPDNTFVIERVTNGAIITDFPIYLDSNDREHRKEIYVLDDYEPLECDEKAIDILWEIVDLLGLNVGNKYSKKRLRIEFIDQENES